MTNTDPISPPRTTGTTRRAKAGSLCLRPGGTLASTCNEAGSVPSANRSLFAAIAACVCLSVVTAGVPLFAQTQSFDDTWDAAYSGKNPQAQPPRNDGRSDGRSGRVRFLEGEMKIDRYEEERSETATVNAPIFAGDSATTSTGARTEVQLAGGAVISLDERTRMTFLSLPDPEATDEDTVLQLSEGSVEIEVHKLRNHDADFRIDTASASIYLLAGGRYRIDIEGSYGQTRVSCYRGVAEVAGDDGSVMVRSGQRTFVDRNSEPQTARAFNTAASDAFDGWVVDRTGSYERADSGDELDLGALDNAQVPDEVAPYQQELSYYGSWVNIAPYGPCWVPGGVSASWRPYYNGYWAYGPSGSFWVSGDPWGWAPYHYGRWSWSSGFGWFWSPGAVFSGAWVSWYYGPSYIGWAPLGYWNYPCAYAPGYYGIDYRCWNFVTYPNYYVRNPRAVYVRPLLVRNEVTRGTGVVVNHPIRMGPQDIRNNPAMPALAVRQAREYVQAHPLIPPDAATRRSFREQERAIVRANPRTGTRSGSAARANAQIPGSQLAGAGSGSAAGSAPRPRPRASELGPRTPHGNANGSGTIGVHPSNHGHSGGSGSGTSGGRPRSLSQPSYDRTRLSPDKDDKDARDAEPLPAPHRHPADADTDERSLTDQPDRHLREFFNSAEPRPGAAPSAGSSSPPQQGQSSRGSQAQPAGASAPAQQGSSKPQSAGASTPSQHGASSQGTGSQGTGSAAPAPHSGSSAAPAAAAPHPAPHVETRPPSQPRTGGNSSGGHSSGQPHPRSNR